MEDSDGAHFRQSKEFSKPYGSSGKGNSVTQRLRYIKASNSEIIKTIAVTSTIFYSFTSFVKIITYTNIVHYSLLTFEGLHYNIL